MMVSFCDKYLTVWQEETFQRKMVDIDVWYDQVCVHVVIMSALNTSDQWLMLVPLSALILNKINKE